MEHRLYIITSHFGLRGDKIKGDDVNKQTKRLLCFVHICPLLYLEKCTLVHKINEEDMGVQTFSGIILFLPLKTWPLMRHKRTKSITRMSSGKLKVVLTDTCPLRQQQFKKRKCASVLSEIMCSDNFLEILITNLITVLAKLITATVNVKCTFLSNLYLILSCISSQSSGIFHRGVWINKTSRTQYNSGITLQHQHKCQCSSSQVIFRS